jgi:hypothetical protein
VTDLATELPDRSGAAHQGNLWLRPNRCSAWFAREQTPWIGAVIGVDATAGATR